MAKLEIEMQCNKITFFEKEDLGWMMIELFKNKSLPVFAINKDGAKKIVDHLIKQFDLNNFTQSECIIHSFSMGENATCFKCGKNYNEI